MSPRFQIDAPTGPFTVHAHMIALLRKLFWVLLFVVFTIGFDTLFDKGFTTSTQFIADMKSEVNEFIAIWRPIKREKDHSDEVDR